MLTTSGGWSNELFSVVFGLVFMELSFSKIGVSLVPVCLSLDLLSGGFVLEWFILGLAALFRLL